MAAAAGAVTAAAAGADRSGRDRHRPPPLVPDPAGGVLRDPPAALALVGLERLGLPPARIVSNPPTCPGMTPSRCRSYWDCSGSATCPRSVTCRKLATCAAP